MADAKEPTHKVADWTGQTYAQRIDNCRMMLVMHGFLTQAESNKVKRRQMKAGVVPKNAIILKPRPSED